jgi:hypothetical protein
LPRSALSSRRCAASSHSSVVYLSSRFFRVRSSISWNTDYRLASNSTACCLLSTSWSAASFSFPRGRFELRRASRASSSHIELRDHTAKMGSDRTVPVNALLHEALVAWCPSPVTIDGSLRRSRGIFSTRNKRIVGSHLRSKMRMPAQAGDRRASGLHHQHIRI